MATKTSSKKTTAKKSNGQGSGSDPMDDLKRLVAEQNFRSIEEVEKFVKDLSKGPIPEFNMEGIQEEAEQLVNQALHADPEVARELLGEALLLDPDHLLAYAILGELEPNPVIALAFFERGITIGAERFLEDDFLKEHRGHFWTIQETRPFLHCLQGAAESWFAMGRVISATMIWTQMLDLDPNDNQGVRFDLMAVLAGLGQKEEFDQLDALFEDDAATATFFNRVLCAFTSNGPGPMANKLLDEAVRSNKHVVPLLLKEDPALWRPMSYTMGSKEEAMAYLDKAHTIWQNVPGVMDWLRQVVPKGRKK